MKVSVFWVVTPCARVPRYRRFGQTHFPIVTVSRRGIITQTTDVALRPAVFIWPELCRNFDVSTQLAEKRFFAVSRSAHSRRFTSSSDCSVYLAAYGCHLQCSTVQSGSC